MAYSSKLQSVISRRTRQELKSHHSHSQELKERNAALLTCPLCPALFLHLCAAQDLENVTAHNGRVLPVSINNQVIALGCAHRPSLSGTFLIKTLSQVSPGCVKGESQAAPVTQWASALLLEPEILKPTTPERFPLVCTQ